MATKLPSIPAIPGNISSDLFAVLSAIKTQLDYAQANPSTSTTNAVDQAQLEAAVANAVTGITKGDTGAPGAPGSNGANGKTYVLDIEGGRTSIIYDASGANPLPAMTAFSAKLYEDGVEVTPSSYSWFIADSANSLLSGTSNTGTFTPTVAGTFNQAKADNSVVLVVGYAGLSIRAVEPIAITKVGSTGATGATGPQGDAGTPGAPGTSSYFHVAYADSADGTTNFNQVSGSYIGTYVDSNPTDSSSPSAYQWVLIKGAQGPQGDQGIPGTKGADGTTSYLHIKYSDDGGATFTASGGEAVGKYIGTYVDTTSADSTNVGDYTWALIKGADGNNGKTYLLFITGGKTNAVYDTSGANPLPSPTAFGCELYEDGSLVTPDTYAWSVPASNSLLTGSSSTATFTPTLAPTFDANKGDNRVLLTVTYAGQTIKAVQPIVITQQVSGTSPDMTTPNAIDNLEVTGGVLYNFLTWGTNPTNTDIDHIDIYRAATDDRASAAVIGTTKARVYADYIPDGVGGTYYYWLRAISKTGVVGDWNLVSGVVSSAGTSSSPLAIGDSQVGTISATKILAATLSAISANLGTVTAGTIQSGDETFKIDLANKSITVAGVGGVAAADYTIMQNGQLQFWKWTGSTHQQGQSLNTIESGIVANGATVTLNKWYADIPDINVFPYDMPLYNAAYPNQSQKFENRAEDITYTSGVVSFTAISRLVLAGSNPSIPVTDIYTGPSNTDTTETYTTDENTTKIDCSVSFSTKRGTGTSPNYYYRKVDARIAYRTSPSGTWNYTTWVTTNIGADFNTHTAVLTTGTIANGTYDFYVEFLSADRGGTFTSGYTEYEQLPGGYAQLSLSSNTSLVSIGPTFSPVSAAISITFPNYSLPDGFTIYSAVYFVSYGYYLNATAGSVNFASSSANIKNYNSSQTFFSVSASSQIGGDVETLGTVNVPSATNSYSFTLGGYSQSITVLNLNATGYHYDNGTSSPDPSASGKAQGKVFADNTYVRIYAQKPTTNTTTPENVFSLISYSLTLSTATVVDSNGVLKYSVIA